MLVDGTHLGADRRHPSVRAKGPIFACVVLVAAAAVVRADSSFSALNTGALTPTSILGSPNSTLGATTVTTLGLGGTFTAGANTLALASATITGTPTWSSSQAITLSSPAQTSVTSLGTLTSLTMGGTLTIGANTLALATSTISGTPTWSSSQAITLSTATQGSVTSLGTLTGLALSGKVTTYNNVATAGEGVADIRAQANITGQTAAATITSYANPAADGDFEVSGQMSVTASTTLSTSIACTYTDVANVARTMILPITASTGTLVALGAITGSGATIWETPVMHIRVKASTTITLKTSTGTFTGVTYSASGVIKKTS